MIKDYINSLDFDTISSERKKILQKITLYIKKKEEEGKDINLNFICTHNSRRSQFGQVWSHLAAGYYRIKRVYTFSGGTKTTAFNERAITAIKSCGITEETIKRGSNPHYQLGFDGLCEKKVFYSKNYDAPENQNGAFAAIMTCSNADDNCPVINGADMRIPLRYDDPKAFDDTPQEEVRYNERNRQIATEIFYAFSMVNQ